MSVSHLSRFYWWREEAARLTKLKFPCQCGQPMEGVYPGFERAGRSIFLRCVCGHSIVCWRQENARGTPEFCGPWVCRP